MALKHYPNITVLVCMFESYTNNSVSFFYFLVMNEAAGMLILVINYFSELQSISICILYSKITRFFCFYIYNLLIFERKTE